MISEIKNMIMEPVYRTLYYVGSILNQFPLHAKVKQSPYFQKYSGKREKAATDQQFRKVLKSGVSAKGSPHSDSKIYNHPHR